MNKLKYTSKTITDQQGATRTFSYYFVVEELEAPTYSIENYGISVEEQGGDSHTIFNISTNWKRVEDLLSMLSTYQVSPTICRDVIDDWL